MTPIETLKARAQFILDCVSSVQQRVAKNQENTTIIRQEVADYSAFRQKEIDVMDQDSASAYQEIISYNQELQAIKAAITKLSH